MLRPLPATTIRHGASAGRSSPGSSFDRCPSSQTTAFVPLAIIRSAIAGGAKAVKSGTWTAPSLQIASTVSTYSTLLPIKVVDPVARTHTEIGERRGETLRCLAELPVGASAVRSRERAIASRGRRRASDADQQSVRERQPLGEKAPIR